jgi:hypothetical protein
MDGFNEETGRERGKGSIGGQEGENMHCTENPIYVFSEMKLRSLIPSS